MKKLKSILLTFSILSGMLVSTFSQQNQVEVFANLQSGIYESGVVNYASQVYMFKFNKKELEVVKKDNQLQYIVLDDSRWYPYDMDNSSYLINQSGDQKLTYIDGKIYQWGGNLSDNGVSLSMMYQSKGYTNKDPKKYLKTLNNHLSKLDVPDTERAEELATAILVTKAKDKMQINELDEAKIFISHAIGLGGYKNPEVINLGKEIENIYNKGQSDKNNQELKADPYSIFGKDVTDLEIKITKHDNSEYSKGYFGYYCTFDVVVEAKLADGGIITTDNFEYLYDQKTKQSLRCIAVDYTVSAYGCRKISSDRFMPYPWKDDMYNPYVTVKVTSNYDSKLSKSIQIPVSFTEPVIVDYRGQATVKPGSYAASPEYLPGDGADITVEVWTGKNEHNNKLMILYDVYETGGELLNTVYLEPNVTLWVYTRGSQSPRGSDGELTVVVKDEKAVGYSVKTDVSNSSGASLTNSNQNSSESNSSEFTIVNETGTSINLIDDDGNGQGHINNGSSKTFSCKKEIYQAKQNSSGTWNIKGNLIANGENNCGQTVTYR